MKKILTMLLSFLMVATLGVVNVSAENKSYVFNINASKDTTYSGEAQTLFEFGGLNEDIGKELDSNNYSIYYSVKEGSGFNNQAEEITWTKYNGETLTIKRADAGHYYFKAAVIKSTASTIVKSLNDIGSDNYSSDALGEAEIAKKVVTVSIKAPMTAKEDGKNIEYFDVGDKEVKLPFSATTDVTGVALKWELKKESTSAIEYDSTTSLLTIEEGLLGGVHDVTLTASVNDGTNYTGTDSVSFKVIKAQAAGYVIAFDGSEYNKESQKNESVFGKTVSEISDGVSSISYRDNTYNVWTKDSTTTSITSKTLSDRDGNVLSKGKLNAGKDYQIKATVKTTYYYDGAEQSYSFDVSDKFDVVAKEALATVVKAKEDLVYSGKDQDLTECTAKDPLSATVKYKVTGAKLSEVSAEAYDGLNTPEVDTPTRKDAGTYFVYYHVIANDTQNYKDGYGMVEVTIDKATLTVSGLEDKTYTYDGKDKLSTVEEAISVEGVADGEKDPYTISFSNSNSDVVNELKNAGTYKVSIALNDANGNYKFASDTTSATVTINTATANMVWATTKTTYYKNTETTAVLTCDGVYGDFICLKIKNGNEWKEVPATNYDVHSGSTVIVLKKDYLQTLEVGKDYTFMLDYSGNYANDPITVLAVREHTAPSNSSSSSSSTTTTTTAKKVVNTSAH